MDLFHLGSLKQLKNNFREILIWYTDLVFDWFKAILLKRKIGCRSTLIPLFECMCVCMCMCVCVHVLVCVSMCVIEFLCVNDT